jgi:ATP-binding cassette subfamily B protein/subfamily B ATP-binding cassette protein MsbA
MQAIAALPDERAERGSAVLRRLTGYVRPYTRQLLLTLGLVILAAVSQALGPYLIGRAIDSAIGQGDSAALNQTMLFLLAVYVGGWLAGRAQIMLIGAIGQRTLSRLRT